MNLLKTIIKRALSNLYAFVKWVLLLIVWLAAMFVLVYIIVNAFGYGFVKFKTDYTILNIFIFFAAMFLPVLLIGAIAAIIMNLLNIEEKFIKPIKKIDRDIKAFLETQ